MSKQDEAIDAAILSAAGDDWTKTAVLISKIYDAPGLKKSEDFGQKIAERIYTLVDHGRLEARGNMRRWRDSDIRLIPPSSRGMK